MTKNGILKSSFFKVSFLIVLSQVIYSALGFIFLPIFLNELSIEEYGLVAYRFNVAQLLATTLILGFDHSIERGSIIKNFSFFYSATLFLITSFVVISCGLGIIFFLLKISFINILDIPSITLIFIFLVLGVMFLRFLAAFNGGHIKGIFIILSVLIFSVFFLNSLLNETITIKDRVNWLLIPSYSVITASVFFAVINFFSKTIHQKSTSNFGDIGKDFISIFRDTKDFIPYILVSTILLNLDKIVIEKFWGTAEVGIYDVSMKLASISLVLFTGFKMLLPKMLSNFNKNKISLWHNDWILASTLVYWILCLMLIFIIHFFFSSIPNLKALIYLANAIVFFSLLNMYGFSARKVEANPLAFSRIILLCFVFSIASIFLSGYVLSKNGLNFHGVYLVVIFCSFLMYVIHRYSSLKKPESKVEISSIDIICFTPIFLNIFFLMSFDEYFSLYNNSLIFNLLFTIIMTTAPIFFLSKRLRNE